MSGIAILGELQGIFLAEQVGAEAVGQRMRPPRFHVLKLCFGFGKAFSRRFYTTCGVHPERNSASSLLTAHTSLHSLPAVEAEATKASSFLDLSGDRLDDRLQAY